MIAEHLGKRFEKLTKELEELPNFSEDWESKQIPSFVNDINGGIVKEIPSLSVRDFQ